MVFKKLKYSYNFLKVIQFSLLGSVFYFNTVGVMDLYGDEDSTNLLTAILFLIGAIILGIVSSVFKSYSISKHISHVLNESGVHFANLKLHRDDLFTYDVLNKETEEVIEQKVISIVYNDGNMYFIELEEAKSPALVLTKDLGLEKGSVSVDPLTERMNLETISEEKFNELFPKPEILKEETFEESEENAEETTNLDTVEEVSKNGDEKSI